MCRQLRPQPINPLRQLIVGQGAAQHPQISLELDLLPDQPLPSHVLADQELIGNLPSYQVVNSQPELPATEFGHAVSLDFDKAVAQFD